MNPPNKRKIPGSPQDWITHAESDLGLAFLGQKHTRILPSQICFHAQQAAEKALKAALRSRNIDFPLTHDLQELIEILEQGGLSFPAEVAEAGSLTPYAVETRYPGSWEEINAAEVQRAVDLASRVVDWAKKVLEEPQKR